MLFQTFDEKKECFLIYINKQFQEHLTEDCKKTWSYAPYLDAHNQQIDYANLYVQKNSIEDASPSYLKSRYDEMQSKFKAILKTTATVGLDLDDICLYDIAPQHFLTELGDLKNEICSYIFSRNHKMKVLFPPAELATISTVSG